MWAGVVLLVFRFFSFFIQQHLTPKTYSFKKIVQLIGMLLLLWTLNAIFLGSSDCNAFGQFLFNIQSQSLIYIITIFELLLFKINKNSIAYRIERNGVRDSEREKVKNDTKQTNE